MRCERESSPNQSDELAPPQGKIKSAPRGDAYSGRGGLTLSNTGFFSALPSGARGENLRHPKVLLTFLASAQGELLCNTMICGGISFSGCSGTRYFSLSDCLSNRTLLWRVRHKMVAAIPLIRYASVLISPTRNVSRTSTGRASPCRLTHTVVYPNSVAGTISYLKPKPACQISVTSNPKRSRARRNPL